LVWSPPSMTSISLQLSLSHFSFAVQLFIEGHDFLPTNLWRITGQVVPI
jgi:hypothetical protein